MAENTYGDGIDGKDIRTLLTGDHEELLTETNGTLRDLILDMTVGEWRGIDDLLNDELSRMDRVKTHIARVRTMGRQTTQGGYR